MVYSDFIFGGMKKTVGFVSSKSPVFLFADAHVYGVHPFSKHAGDLGVFVVLDDEGNFNSSKTTSELRDISTFSNAQETLSWFCLDSDSYATLASLQESVSDLTSFRIFLRNLGISSKEFSVHFRVSQANVSGNKQFDRPAFCLPVQFLLLFESFLASKNDVSEVFQQIEIPGVSSAYGLDFGVDDHGNSLGQPILFFVDTFPYFNIKRDDSRVILSRENVADGTYIFRKSGTVNMARVLDVNFGNGRVQSFLIQPNPEGTGFILFGNQFFKSQDFGEAARYVLKFLSKMDVGPYAFSLTPYLIPRVETKPSKHIGVHSLPQKINMSNFSG